MIEATNQKLNRANLRRIAEKLLTQAGIDSPPVMVRDLVKYLKTREDFNVYPWSFGDKTSGIQLTQGKKSVVGYNNKQHTHRQRFSVCHEIAHFVLGHTRGNDDYKFSQNPGIAEQEASFLAAELLMPYRMIKGNLGSGLTDINQLAEKYNVSSDAMWIRIKECGLINKLP